MIAGSVTFTDGQGTRKSPGDIIHLLITEKYMYSSMMTVVEFNDESTEIQ